jgi:hypothetical protein
MREAWWASSRDRDFLDDEDIVHGGDHRHEAPEGGVELYVVMSRVGERDA